MKKNNSTKKNYLIAALLIIASNLIFVFSVNKIFKVGAKSEKQTNLVDELGKYNCEVLEKETDYTISKYYVTDDNCPFVVEFNVLRFYDEDFFKVLLDRIDNNGIIKEEKSFKINDAFVNKESEGDYYKFVSKKNMNILYLSTSLENKEEAQNIIENLGFRYRIIFQFKYLILPIILFVFGIFMAVYNPEKKKSKGRKK